MNGFNRNMLRKTMAFVLSFLLVFGCYIPGSLASNVEIDEEGGIWDYDKGIYTDPEGMQHSIENTGSQTDAPSSNPSPVSGDDDTGSASDTPSSETTSSDTPSSDTLSSDTLSSDTPSENSSPTGVETDEEGGTWDYDKGIYTDPDGIQHPIENTDDSGASSSGENSPNENAIYDEDGRIFIVEDDSPVTIENKVSISSEDRALYPAVGISSGSFAPDEDTPEAGKTEAHFQGDIQVELNRPSGHEDDWSVGGTALEADSYGGETVVVVDGSVAINVTKQDEITQSVATAVSANANRDGSTELSIAGNIEAKSDGFSTGLNISNDWANDIQSSTIKASVGNDIIAEGDRGARGIYAVEDKYSDGLNETINWDIDVGNNISAKGGTEEGTGVGLYIDHGTANIAVGGNIDASSDSSSTGTDLYFRGENAQVNLTVAGDVTVDGNQRSRGISVYQGYNGNEANVNIGGNIKVDTTEDFADVAGVYIEQYGKETVSNVDVDGSITIESQGDCADASAIEIKSNGGKSNIVIGGDLEARTNYGDDSISRAIEVNARGGAELSIDVDGKVYSNSPTNSWTVDVKSQDSSVNISIQDGAEMHADNGSALSLETKGENSSINVDLNGDLKAVTANNEWRNIVRGAFLNNQGGSIDVQINGNIIGTDGIVLCGGDKLERIPVEDDTPINIERYDIRRYHGSENDEYDEYDEYDENAEEYYSAQVGYFFNKAGDRWVEVDKTTMGSNSVFVDGDVIAEDTGIYIDNWSENVSENVIISGTLSGGERAVEYMNGTQIDNFTLTVWKVEQNDSGNIIESFNGKDENKNKVYEADREAEQRIQYIIKIDETSADSITGLEGTTEIMGYDTAHEGDTVTLKITVPNGFRVTGAYNGNGNEKMQLQQDANGNYYVVVPKGGGVLLSAMLEQISSDNLASANASDSGVIVKVEKAKLKVVSDTDQTKSIKENLLTEAYRNKLLVDLPESVRNNFGETIGKFVDTLTVRLVDYNRFMGNVKLLLKTSKAFAEGEEAKVLIISPEGEDIHYYGVKGVGTRNGGLMVTLDAETAQNLMGKVFIAMIFE